MNKLRFRPRLWSTLLVLAAVVALGALGRWQWARYHQKLRLEATRTKREAAQPVHIRSLADFDNPKNDYRVVDVDGTLHTDRSAVFEFRTHNGRPGCWIASLLTLDSGGSVLVNRGFIPVAHGNHCDPSEAETPDAHRWEGLLYTPTRVFPDDVGRKRHDPNYQWRTFDVDGAYAELGARRRPRRPAVVVLSAHHSGANWPAAGYDEIIHPYLTSDRHLSYAITWFSLMASALGMWVWASLRRV